MCDGSPNGVRWVSKRVRRSADYFTSLPKGDPLAKTPRQAAERSGQSRRAVNALVPGWAQEDGHDEDGDRVGPRLPDGKQWAHLADDEPFEADELEAKGPGKQSWLKTLVVDRDQSKADNPARVLEEDSVRLDRLWTSSAEDGGRDPLERLRQVGLQLAAEHEGARSPRFQRANAEGVSASDYPLPGTSFALMGVRGSFGRQRVTSVEVEADRLFYDDNDLRHAGKPDVKSAPLSAYRARKMKPGERYQVRAQRTILADAGVKYTPTMLPGVSSSMLHDLGPGVSTEVTVAVEGDTTLEIVRGFGSEVAVRIDAQDERVKPGRDNSWKAMVGLFVDGSLLEYGAENFKALAESNVKRELESLEDRRRLIDQKITPVTEQVNRRGAAFAEVRRRASEETVNLVEVTFDLSKPDARKAFNQLVGTNYRGARGIDFDSLAGLDPEAGVRVVRNNVTEASRTGVRRAFGAFGYETQQLRMVEKRETKKAAPGDAVTIKEQHHALLRRTRGPSHEAVSTTIGRVKTVTDDATGESRTGVGFGWQFEVGDAHASRDDLAQVLTVAAVTSGDPADAARLSALHTLADQQPRKKVLGLPLGKRGFGEAQAGFRVEMNAEAVRRLLGALETPEGKAALYRGMAEAFAMQHGLDAPPAWPVARLDADGVLGALGRNLLPLSSADNAFLEARAALRALEAAGAEDDPVASAKILAQAMAFLRHEIGMAAALVAAARGPDDAPGVEVEIDRPKLEALEAAARPEGELSPERT